MNARSAPCWVFSHHAEDEFAQFPAHASPACTSAMPREPLPVQLESGPMPTDNRLRPHENQRTLPSIPEPPQDHPEQFVRDSKPRLWVPPFQNSELLPESQIFQQQLAARVKESDSQNKEKHQETEHEPVSHGDWQREARNSSD
jgi:hypothetical protein